MQAAARMAIPHREYRPPTSGPSRIRVARSQSGLQHLFVSFVTGAVLVASVLGLNVAQRVLIGQQVMEMDRLQKSIQTERVLQEGLLAEAKELRSPERVARIAVRELAMRKPVSVRYLYMPASLFSGSEAAAGRRSPAEPAHPQVARPGETGARGSVGAFFRRAGDYMASLIPGASDARAARN